MRTTITRIYQFDAAHKLPDEFGGPATRVHGHTYTVRVTHAGGTRTEDTDTTWERLRDRFDHRLLNDAFDDTTVESLAELLLHEFDALAVELQEGNLRYARAER